MPGADQVFDGHSIVLVGYEETPGKTGGGVFLFRNCAGPRWGDEGYGRISYAYTKAYANDALWLQIEPEGAEAPIHRYEAESLPILEKGNFQVTPQEMDRYGAPMWSRGKQLFCGAGKGGSVELAFDVARKGRYRIRVLATAAPDFGKIQIAVDGRRSGPLFDLYAGRVCPAGSLELGVVDLEEGGHRLRFTSEGKNAYASNFYFGIDAIDLLRRNSIPPARSCPR